MEAKPCCTGLADASADDIAVWELQGLEAVGWDHRWESLGCTSTFFSIFHCISNLNVIVLLLALYYLNLVESLDLEDLEDLEKTTDEHRFSQTDSEVVARQEGSEQAGVAPAVVHNG